MVRRSLLRSRLLFSVAAACCCLVSPILGQQTFSETAPAFWIAAGIGPSSLGFIAGSANASVHLDPVLISARATANAQDLFGGDEFYDAAALVGIGAAEGAGFASIAIGVGWVWGSRWAPGPGWFDGTRSPVNGTLGFPLEAQVSLRGAAVGFGLYLFANLNAEQSFTGLTINLQLGSFR